MKSRSTKYRLEDRIIAEVKVGLDVNLGDLDLDQKVFSTMDHAKIKKLIVESINSSLRHVAGLNPVSYTVKVIEIDNSSVSEESGFIEDGE